MDVSMSGTGPCMVRYWNARAEMCRLCILHQLVHAPDLYEPWMGQHEAGHRRWLEGAESV